MNLFKKIVPTAVGILAAALLFTNPIQAEAKEETQVIPDHISICGEDVSGMTEEEANQVVSDYLKQYADVTFKLQADDRSVEASGEDLSLMARNGDVATRALHYGKEGSVISRYKANKDMENGTGKDFQISITVDEATTQSYLEKHSEKLDIKPVNNTVKKNGSSFDYVEGSEGIVVQTEKSAVAIADYVSTDWDGKDTTIDLITQVVEPQGTKEELAKIKDLLGTYHTDFSTSSASRSTNVKNGASKINGSVIYPGEEFSVYEAVSPFDAENGYALAGSYENGTTVETYGGGICQVSTTLYNAVMRAELEIVTRSCHSMIVNYVDPSMDAAIAGTAKDFQFKNNQKSPVYIEGYTSGGIIYFNVYGEETRPSNRKVDFVSEVTSQTDAGVKFVAAPELPVGTVNKTQSAHTGYTARLWKIVTVDGVEESRKVYNNSTYKPSDMIYSVGTASDNAEAVAAINAAIASNDEATIRGAAAQWSAEGIAAANAAKAQQEQDAAAQAAQQTQSTQQTPATQPTT